jgi:hypothetical protein
MSSAERHDARPPLTLVGGPTAREGRRPTWSPAEDDILRAEYDWGKGPALAARLGRPVEGVRQRARILGLVRHQQARIIWDDAANAVLRAHYGRVPTPQLAAQLGTTIGAVWTQARELGVARPAPHQPWSADEDRLLRELAGTMPRAALARRLGRTPLAISGRMQTLGLTREVLVAQRAADDQREQQQLRERVRRLEAELRRPPPAAGDDADSRRLAVLLAYRLRVISAAEAAVVVGVPMERLPVEVGKAAARGLEIVAHLTGGNQ